MYVLLLLLLYYYIMDINYIDYNYLKNNILSVLFQLWYTPLLYLSLINGSYYDNEMVFIEYIRNYELLNLLYEFFYANPFCIRSSLIIHHVMAIISPTLSILYKNDNLQIINDMNFVTTITVTTSFLLDACKILHKNIPLKVVFFLQYFSIRILFPLSIIYNCSTGVYIQNMEPKHYIVTSTIYSIIYMGYCLNIFWFYKIVRIVKKLMNTSKQRDKPQQPLQQPPQHPQTPIPSDRSNFVYVPCGH